MVFLKARQLENQNGSTSNKSRLLNLPPDCELAVTNDTDSDNTERELCIL